MKRIVTGITSTGKLTIGHYTSVIKNLIDLQNEKEIFLFVADLHSLTNNITSKDLNKNVLSMLKLLVACGIDYKKIKLFVQSRINSHLELFYFLLVNSTIGELSRMVQFKEKSLKNKQENKTNKIPSGILLYPILQSADIMIYNPDEVIIGKDQTQHLELTRNIIKRVNKKYDLDFKIPKTVISKTGNKINSLRNPDVKMSKTDSNLNNVIFLLDNIEDVDKKIKTSLTDSENKVYFSMDKKPGISNLLNIVSALTGEEINNLETKYENSNYMEFKAEVSNVVCNLLKEIQKKYNSISDNDIEVILKYNENNIQKISGDNLKKIKTKIGLNYE